MNRRLYRVVCSMCSRDQEYALTRDQAAQVRFLSRCGACGGRQFLEETFRTAGESKGTVYARTWEAA